MKRAFLYRAYCNKTTEKNALEWLELCRTLYNLALEQKAMLYKQWNQSISIRSHKEYRSDNPMISEMNKDLLSLGINGQLPELKEAFPEFKKVSAMTLIHVTDRLKKAFQAFFLRIQNGETPGYPRFKSKNRYDSFTLSDSCWRLDGTYLHVKNIGTFKLKLHRKIQGTIKQITIKKDVRDKWYVSFSCENVKPRKYSVPPATDIGIDMGINVFLYDSDGKKIENPRFLRQIEDKLAKLQREWDKIKHHPKSKSKDKIRLHISKLHEKVSQQRKDFLHKITKKYVRKYGSIYHEDLNIGGMKRRPKKKQDEEGRYLRNGASRKAGLNKSISDVAWGTFFELLKYKAEEAGRTVIKVDPRYTSQKCSRCGELVPKTLAVREHACPICGLTIDRDYNASLNIKKAGQALAGIIPCGAPFPEQESNALRSIYPDDLKSGDCQKDFTKSNSDKERAQSSRKTGTKKQKKIHSRSVTEALQEGIL
ncbi:MAG: RNA-guided endonuclease InsQ/TnpB family protein [Vulcanimicrobiota bacterium]